MKKDDEDIAKKIAALRTAVADSDEHLAAVDDSLLNRRAEIDKLDQRLTTLESVLGRLIEQERKYQGLPTRDQLAPQKVPGPGWANPVEPGA
jgi:chromosome segregation ATPase